MQSRIIKLLPAKDQARLFADSLRVSFPLMRKLCWTNDKIDAIYFPLDCVVSLLAGAGEEAKIEMAIIGNEGVVGVFSILNGHRALADNAASEPRDGVAQSVTANSVANVLSGGSLISRPKPGSPAMACVPTSGFASCDTAGLTSNLMTIPVHRGRRPEPAAHRDHRRLPDLQGGLQEHRRGPHDDVTLDDHRWRNWKSCDARLHHQGSYLP